MVEPQPSKLMTRVRFPSPAPETRFDAGSDWLDKSPFGSVVEHSLGKGEVAGPIPAKGTSFWGLQQPVCSPSAYVEIVFFGVEKWQKVNSPAPSRT
jgi:hypothetical protein